MQGKGKTKVNFIRNDSFGLKQRDIYSLAKQVLLMMTEMAAASLY